MHIELNNASAPVLRAALQAYVDRNDKLAHTFRTGGDTGGITANAIANLERHNATALRILRSMDEQEVMP